MWQIECLWICIINFILIVVQLFNMMRLMLVLMIYEFIQRESSIRLHTIKEDDIGCIFQRTDIDFLLTKSLSLPKCAEIGSRLKISKKTTSPRVLHFLLFKMSEKWISAYLLIGSIRDEFT